MPANVAHKAGHADVDYVRDLFQGFPITGTLQSGGCGEHIEGGQRAHGKPGLGGPAPLSEPQEMCGVRNQSTLKSAKARTPRTEEEVVLARETWSKLQQDIQKGFMGQPVELDQLDLNKVLLVDTFGVWEKHAGTA